MDKQSQLVDTDAPASGTFRGLPRRDGRAIWVRAIVIALALALTAVLSDFRLFQATMVLAYAIALIGLNILTGFSGQISLGHGAFFALGAYATAILMGHFEMPYWIAIPVGGIVGFAAGYAFGRPALRLSGIYLGLATFALAVATPQLLKFHGVEEWTGGVQGIFLTKPSAPLGLPLSDDQWLYLYALVLVGIIYWIAHSLLESGTGRALRSIRDNALAAEAIGIDSRHHKFMAFGISAAFAAVAGGLAATAVQFVSPDAYDLFLSVSLLVGAVVGGISTLNGAVIGALFIVYVPTLADSISKSAPWAVYGVVMILLVYLMPEGIAGAIRKASRAPVSGRH
ncbi:branched-chain amino acid ABC transporter permease [Bosea sp. F3-2]|nr:branched-chain amino acid ABC transporter permease [Bosea sp. F3-2]